MLVFEKEKLRDQNYQRQFYQKLEEIHALRRKHTYIGYATNREKFEELQALYEQNLLAYQTHYEANFRRYEAIRARAKAAHHRIHKARYAELRELYRQIDALLQQHAYEENAKSAGLIDQLEEKVEQFVEEYARWESQLAHMRTQLKELRTQSWAEDYENFLQTYKEQQARIHGKVLPQGEAGFSEDKLSRARDDKSQGIARLRRRAGKAPGLQSRIHTLEETAATRADFQALEKIVNRRMYARHALYGLLGLGLLVALLLAAIYLPQAYRQYQEKQLWLAVKDSNTYHAYSHYLDMHPHGRYRELAKKYRMALNYGEIPERHDRNGTYSYAGELSKEEPHGQGTAIYTHGDRYEGEWNYGLRSGKGVLTEANGNRYEGEWLNGLPHGKGVYTWVNGTVYDGQWEAGRRHGRGTLKQPLLGTYTGQFVADTMEGKGTFVFEDGSKYVGNWKSGRRHGQGVYYFAEGGRYDGNWVQDFREGYGRMQWKDGRVYKGAWRADEPSGEGEMFWPDGSHFKGHWSAGKIDGQGTYTSRIRDTFTGRWETAADGTLIVYDNSGIVIRKGRFRDGLFMTLDE